MLSQFLVLAALGSSAYAAGTVAVYGQCGGQGYTGPTTCAAGSHCVANGVYYSQCLPGSATTTKASTKAATTAKSTSPAQTSAIAAGTYKASFTEYGAGDTFGSPNCQTTSAACGFYTTGQTGYSAAVSQNEFGVGPGGGAGPACGTCWRLTAETDSSGNRLSNAGNSIVVKINNLCPASGNPLCAQNGLSGTNQYGANLNFDTCIDSGASAALFGNSGVGLAIGTAQEVDCSLWHGTIVS
ncbi:hypothetical protein MBLNU457_3106t1 [Dothideomycetes sp. NU457]